MRWIGQASIESTLPEKQEAIKFHRSASEDVSSASDGSVIAWDEILNGIVTVTPTGNISKEIDNATNIIKGLGLRQPGDRAEFCVVNKGEEASITITAGVGVTIVGTPVIWPLSSCSFAAVKTNIPSDTDGVTLFVTAGIDAASAMQHLGYTGDITGVTAGTLLDGGGTSGSVTLNVDLSELTDGTAAIDGSQDELVYLDNGSQKRKLVSEINLDQFNNNLRLTTSNISTDTFVIESEGISSNDNDTTFPSSAAVKDFVENSLSSIGSDSLTFTNKTIDANGTGNNISNIDIGNMTAACIVTEAEGVSSNDNDTTIPTSAATKDYADTNRRTKRLRFISANFKDNQGTTETFIPLSAQPEEKTGFGNEQVLYLMPTGGYVKEIIIRAHYGTYTSENIVYKVYRRPKNKKVNGSTQVGSDITIAAPTQNATDDNNTRSTGDLGTTYGYTKWDMLGISATWQTTGPTASSDKTYITVVLEEDMTDLGY